MIKVRLPGGLASVMLSEGTTLVADAQGFAHVAEHLLEHARQKGCDLVDYAEAILHHPVQVAITVASVTVAAPPADPTPEPIPTAPAGGPAFPTGEEGRARVQGEIPAPEPEATPEATPEPEHTEEVPDAGGEPTIGRAEGGH